MAARSGAEAGRGPVHTPADPDGPTVVVLVPESVGEGPDRFPADDHEPVAVQEGVQVAQPELAVAPEEGEADAPEAAAVEGHRVGHERRERWPVDRRRASPLLPRHDRVEQIPSCFAPLDDGPAPAGEVVELLVEGGQLGQVVVVLDLQLDPPDPVEVGVPADGDATEVEVADAASEGGIVHDRALR